MENIIIEGNANDCLMIAAKMKGYSSSKRVNDNYYVFTFEDKSNALKAIIYLWKKIKNISIDNDGLSENKEMLFFRYSCTYIE